jgi:hypothetical protein
MCLTAAGFEGPAQTRGDRGAWPMTLGGNAQITCRRYLGPRGSGGQSDSPTTHSPFASAAIARQPQVPFAARLRRASAVLRNWMRRPTKPLRTQVPSTCRQWMYSLFLPMYSAISRRTSFSTSRQNHSPNLRTLVEYCAITGQNSMSPSWVLIAPGRAAPPAVLEQFVPLQREDVLPFHQPAALRMPPGRQRHGRDGVVHREVAQIGQEANRGRRRIPSRCT